MASARQETSNIVVNMYDDPNSIVQEGEISSKIMSKMVSPREESDNGDYEDDTGFTQKTNNQKFV